jgi:hypothetical protein
MSQENVEPVRRFLEAIGPDSGGHDAFRRHAMEFEDAWSEWGIEIEEIGPVRQFVIYAEALGAVGLAK